MRAAVMSGVEPGSTSETHSGVPSGDGQELHVAAERLVFLAEPQVVAVVADPGEAVGLDQGAVQDHVRHALAPAAVQDVVQVGGLVGEDVDAFVEVAVAGGLGDAGVAGQAVHAAALAEPAQDQHGLAERAQRPRCPAGCRSAADGRPAAGTGGPRRGAGRRAWQHR